MSAREAREIVERCLWTLEAPEANRSLTAAVLVAGAACGAETLTWLERRCAGPAPLPGRSFRVCAPPTGFTLHLDARGTSEITMVSTVLRRACASAASGGAAWTLVTGLDEPDLLLGLAPVASRWWGLPAGVWSGTGRSCGAVAGQSVPTSVGPGSIALWIGPPDTTSFASPPCSLEIAPEVWERLHARAGESLLDTDRRPDPND